MKLFLWFGHHIGLRSSGQVDLSKTKQIYTYSSLADITPNDDETTNVLTITNITKGLILVFSVMLHSAKSSHIKTVKNANSGNRLLLDLIC